MTTDIAEFNGRHDVAAAPMGEAVVNRQASEVQMAMLVAKRFPRNETASFARIMQACKRKGLAESATYAYPRGGQQITGPSIRLAEVLAQAWGNIDFGIVELAQIDGESEVMAYAWDLETNSRQVKVFTVKHERHKKNGVDILKDPRDIYETVANNGARRLRACILGIIPGDIVDAALEACEKTMSGSGGEPIADRIRKMVAAFAEHGVTQEMMEKRIGHKVEACIDSELASLRKIFTSIKDGVSKRDQWFEVGVVASDSPSAGAAKDKLKPKEEKPKEAGASEETLILIEDELRRTGLAADTAKVQSFLREHGAKGLKVATKAQADKILDALRELANAEENADAD